MRRLRYARFRCHTRVKNARTADRPYLLAASLQSLRQVKSLTHIPPALQAGFRANRCAIRSPAAPRMRSLPDLQIRHRAQRCAAHLPGVLRQRTAARIGFAAAASLAPALELGRADVQGDFATLCINRDFVPVLHQRQSARRAPLRARRAPPRSRGCRPEKRPSVISATLDPKPLPMMAPVGLNISRIPGPPFGPS